MPGLENPFFTPLPAPQNNLCSAPQKCGTTSMASYLQTHPGVSGLAGMPGNETFQKESHFFGGILGRECAGPASAALYRSFFPTILTRCVGASACVTHMCA